ncbi:hypothetical protein [Streptomyces sp. NPDC048350]|uniref:hypothetical protein n=1 Tax=Streptomyces sp. NPDC048350 TaxID=3365538 RepID=UPI003712D888
MPGARGWFKVRRRETTEVVIGRITGTIRHPQILILGRYDTAGRLRAVGRTTPLKPEPARQLADHLTPAGPEHPWSRGTLDPILVIPDRVAEISADTAIDRGTWRHPLRFVGLRLDVAVADMPTFGEGTQPASG